MESSQCAAVGFLLLGMRPPSAVRTARFVQRDNVTANVPPAEKRHVLPRGETESILLSPINLELAPFFSLCHLCLPTTISFCALLHLHDHSVQPHVHSKQLRRDNGQPAPCCPPAFGDSAGLANSVLFAEPLGQGGSPRSLAFAPVSPSVPDVLSCPVALWV